MVAHDTEISKDKVAFYRVAWQNVGEVPVSDGDLATGGPARWSAMADALRSQADADGMAFGYLGVMIRGADVWTIGGNTPSRRLGPLKDACAGVIEPRRSWIGSYISSLLLHGNVPPKNARLYIAFADGTRYERMLLPWVSVDAWPRIAGQIGRFNAAAYLAQRR